MTESKFLDPKNDVAFKKLFGSEENKDILIHFINDILERKDSNKIQNVTFLSPIQNPDIASKKQSIVDVLCEDVNGVQIIVEMQVSPMHGFEKRAQYYVAKAYSSQLNKGSEETYDKLKGVIFIAISDSIIFPEKKEYNSSHAILDIYDCDLGDFSFTFIELPKFKKQKGDKLHNMIEEWIHFFKYAGQATPEDLKKLIGNNKIISTAYEALNRFNWNEKELRAYEQSEKSSRDHLATMDYQYEKGKEEGIEKGIRKGIEKGREEGREQGEKQKANSIAKSLLESGIEINIIAKSTGLTIKEIEQLQNKTTK